MNGYDKWKTTDPRDSEPDPREEETDPDRDETEEIRTDILNDRMREEGF